MLSIRAERGKFSMFVNPKYVVPKPDGAGFRAKSDSDTCLQFDKISLLDEDGAEEISSQASRPQSAPCKDKGEKLASPVLVFGHSFSDSDDEVVSVAAVPK